MEGTNGLKQRGRAIGRSLVLSILGHLVPLPKAPFLRPLYFHGVFDREVERFESMLRRLQGIGSFVDTETCLAMLQGRMPIGRRYFHLSFDDGHRNFIENAAPILKRLGIPAIVFVITDLVGADKVRGTVERMTWDELKTVHAMGFEVGSHTRTHARLAGLADDESLESEIVGSKRDIEERLALQCKYFAWPYGRTRDVNDRALEMVRSAGYQGCFGAFRGSVVPGQTNPFSIPRHHLDPEWPWAHVRYFAYGYREVRR